MIESAKLPSKKGPSVYIQEGPSLQHISQRAAEVAEDGKDQKKQLIPHQIPAEGLRAAVFPPPPTPELLLLLVALLLLLLDSPLPADLTPMTLPTYPPNQRLASG